MIDGLCPYPETKPSGLPWLGDLPAHWDVRRNGRLFGSRRETGFPDLPMLEVSLRSGVRVRDFDNGMRKQEMGDRSKYQRAVRGDIAYNMMRMWQGAVGIAPVDGLVSPAYVVARPFAETDAAYYAYVFRTAAYMREVDTFSRGIVPDRNRLYWESFKQMPSVCPPLGEQRLIVRFLDWHGAQTAKLIRAKKKIIALLNEQKQAIIHRAVTRGLDPNAKLKPSGIPWLGDVPEGWQVKRLKAVCRFIYGDSLSSDMRVSGDVHVYGSNGSVGTHTLANTKAPCIIIGRKGSFGKVNWSDQPVFAIDTTYFVDKRSSDSPLRWLYHLLVWLHLDDVSKDSAVPGLAREDAYQRRLAVPTDPAEQCAIAKFIDDECRELNVGINAVQHEIALIQEFRTRLIANVVTGKLDVRAAAASLPEVTEPEPIDDLAEVDDLDEVPDDAENEEVAA
jgi:type I restriction enzyme S subunit